MSAPTAAGTHRAATRHRGIGEKDHKTNSDNRCLPATPTILAPRQADPTISGRVGVAPGKRAKKPAHQREAFTAFAADSAVRSTRAVEVTPELRARALPDGFRQQRRGRVSTAAALMVQNAGTFAVTRPSRARLPCNHGSAAAAATGARRVAHPNNGPACAVATLVHGGVPCGVLLESHGNRPCQGAVWSP